MVPALTHRKLQAIRYLDRALLASKELTHVPAIAKACSLPLDQPAGLLAQRGSICAQLERFGDACASFKAALQLDVSCCLVRSSCLSTDHLMLVRPLIVPEESHACF